MAEVALPGGRVASYQVIGSGRQALMLAGGPGFAVLEFLAAQPVGSWPA